jgi:polygalacturonase
MAASANVSVRYIPGTGNNTATSVAISGNILTVTLSTNATGAVNATAADVLKAVVNNPEASALAANYSVPGSASGFTAATIAAVAASGAPKTTAPAQFNVRTFGAVGDTQTKDTAAFQKALDACAAAGGGEVVVPAGNYTVGSLVMGSNTTLRLEKNVFVIESPDVEDYPIWDGRFEGASAPVRRALISANKANHIAIVGPGGLVATAGFAAQRYPRFPARPPVVVEPVDCNDVILDGFSIQYDRSTSPQIWCVHPNFCTNAVAKNLYIRSQGTNGDGLDIDACNNFLVDHCDISAGDDAISIKSGRGMDAVRIGKPCENVIIQNSTLVSTHFAAVGFGTEISGGVRNIKIQNCTMSGVQNCIFIKSRDGRGGYMEDITGENLTINKSPTFIGIDLVSKGTQASEPVPGDIEKWTLVRNLTFKNIKVNNVTNLVETQRSAAGTGVSPDRPIDGLTLENITGTCTRSGITLTNVLNAHFSGINITGYNGPLMTLTNVTGTGLDNVTVGASAPAPAKP